MKVIKHKDKWYLKSETGYKEILLSTDTELIQDGVQAIDDEFLQWFVKNPSCEEVEIDYQTTDITEKGEWLYNYGIIIPTEEPFKHIGRVIPKEEILANRCSAYEFIDFDKQETLEEAFRKLDEQQKGYTKFDVLRFGATWQQKQNAEEIQDLKNRLDIVNKSSTKAIKLVEELQQNSYSEEDMFDCWKASSTANISDESLKVHFNVWFKKFKKK